MDLGVILGVISLIGLLVLTAVLFLKPFQRKGGEDGGEVVRYYKKENEELRRQLSLTRKRATDSDSSAAFFASPDLQAEFGDVETYRGWLKAQAAGCRIIGNKTITGFARDSR